MTTASEPAIVDGRFGAERGDRERHGHAMVAARVGHAAGRPNRAALGSSNDKAIVAFVGVDAERAKAGDERRDPIAFLDPQLRWRRGRSPRLHGPRARAIAGSSSISPGTSSGEISTASAPIAFDDDGAARFAGVDGCRLDHHARAEPLQHAEERRSRRIQPDVDDLDARARQRQRRRPSRTPPTKNRRES